MFDRKKQAQWLLGIVPQGSRAGRCIRSVHGSGCLDQVAKPAVFTLEQVQQAFLFQVTDIAVLRLAVIGDLAAVNA